MSSPPHGSTCDVTGSNPNQFYIFIINYIFINSKYEGLTIGKQMNLIVQGQQVDRSMASSILLLARPHFLIPGFLLYCLGFMFAVYNDGVLSLDQFLLGYSIMLPAHLAVSFSNDYFDVEADAISKRNPISGGSGILVQRPELRPLALRISLGLMLLSAIMATIFFLVYHPAWYFLPFAWGGNLVGWYYTAPPLRFVYRGLGEVSTAIAAAIIMPGLGYMCSFGALDLNFLALAVVLLGYGFFFIITVEMPDIESDRLAGKNNLLVRIGLRYGMSLAMAVTLLGSFLFFIAAMADLFGAARELWVLFFASLLPSTLVIYGLWRYGRPGFDVNLHSKLYFSSLMFFIILVDMLLLYLIGPLF
jgi:1,4-dihydroxy-2-naphthoate polyprenyltransferase